MIRLTSKHVPFVERPQNVTDYQITESISIDLSQSPDNFSIVCLDKEINYSEIDNKKPFITARMFTIDLYEAKFTFSSGRKFFTLREFCECILTAWHAPLSRRQCKSLSKVFDSFEDIEGVIRLDKVFPPTSLNGLTWSDRMFVPLEMQD